jgi:hypothetical protein
MRWEHCCHSAACIGGGPCRCECPGCAGAKARRKRQLETTKQDSTAQRCAYCNSNTPVNRKGYLRSHFNGTCICVGTGFPRDLMMRLLARLAEIRSDALAIAGSEAERNRNASL